MKQSYSAIAELMKLIKNKTGYVCTTTTLPNNVESVVIPVDSCDEEDISEVVSVVGGAWSVTPVPVPHGVYILVTPA